MGQKASLGEILGSVRLLSTEEKIKLIKHLSDQIEMDLKGKKTGPRRSLRGLWKGLNITELAEKYGHGPGGRPQGGRQRRGSAPASRERIDGR